MHAGIHALAHLLAPWQSLYSNSKIVSGAVTFVHLAGLLFGGGYAVAADRATFRAVRAAPEDRGQLLRDLAAVHRPILIGLGTLFLSGLLQLTADIETFATSPIFWTKMGLVLLLVGNGYRLMRTERALSARGDSHIEDQMWRRLHRAAVTSMVLWAAILLAGTMLLSSS